MEYAGPKANEDGYPDSLVLPNFLTKGEAVYMMVRQRVLEGVLPPGSVLDQELLARELGVSTTPLREAIRRLEGQGLVRISAHKDVIVAPMSRRELQELYEIRLVMDPLAVRLAAEHSTEEEHATMHALLAQTSSTTAFDHLRHNRAIHRSLYVGSGNRVLVQSLETLWDMSDRYRYALLQNAAETINPKALSDHRKIVEAVSNGGADEAERLMREHLLHSLDAFFAVHFPDEG
jgi:DNA-binding GntR family transcriptional regulator